MILVVGGTGTLGGEICHRLRRRGLAVRALVRQTASSARLKALHDAGVNLCWGDLKDAGSLREACNGAEVMISTASSTFSRQGGDSIETVGRRGQLSLIAAARANRFALYYANKYRLMTGPKISSTKHDPRGGEFRPYFQQKHPSDPRPTRLA